MRHSPVAKQSFGGLERFDESKPMIRIQDPNTFLCAENAMNVQARESLCHGKNCIVGQKAYNINVFSLSVQNSVTPIIESVRTPARITPYPTGRLFGVALSQALRARLRSHRPSGTCRNRLSLQELAAQRAERERVV